MKVVLYARFSSHSQTEQSIEGQLKVCYEYAKRNDYQIIGEYIDRAISGTNAENRPEFQRMIADSVKRQFTGVLVYQLDRFARNRYDSATYKARLKKNGVRVLSAKENISDDASGILMEALLEGMAEYYSAELSQKIKRGIMLNAEKAQVTGGHHCLGYKIVEKKFVIDEDTAPVIRKIYEMYLNNYTMAEIIRYLNGLGLRTSQGNEFNKNSIRRILTNKKYIGLYSSCGVEIQGGVPQIIENEIFEEVQIMMQKNKKAPARAKAVEEQYLLTTKLFCGHCESAMTGISGTSKTGAIHQYYQCVNNRRKSGCKKKTIKKDEIETIVINEIVKVLTPSNIQKIAKEVALLSEKERNSNTLKLLKKNLYENKKATDNLIKALESGKAVDIIVAQIETRQKEKTDIECQIAKEELNYPQLTAEQIEFFLYKMSQGDITDSKHRQALVNVFLNKVYLFDDPQKKNKKITILCNTQDSQIEIPLDELESSSKGHSVDLAGVEPASESPSI